MQAYFPAPTGGALPGLVVISHGMLAKGLLASAEMILGPQENAAAICFEEGDVISDFRAEIRRVLDTLPEDSVVLLDMFAGTPCNQITMLILEEKRDIHAFTGVNLPILLEACSARAEFGGTELVDALEEMAGDTIVNLEKKMKAALPQ